jgi:hypothetical protein
MAKITSAGRLYRTEVDIDTTNRDIGLTKTTTGNTLSDDGVSLQALYSYLKNVWRLTDFTSTIASSSGTTVTFDDVSIDVDAAGLVTGTKYQIKVAGDANWTDIGSPDSTVGTVFTYNGVAITGTTGEASTRGNSLNILPGMKVSISAGSGTLAGGFATVVSVAADGSSMTLDQTPSPVMDNTTELLVVNHLIEYPFPLVAITPEQFEFGFDWTMETNTDRKLLRDAGWQELSVGEVDGPKYVGIVSLGTIDTVTIGAGVDSTADTTLAVDTITGITVGMEVRVLSGTGTIPANTKVVSIDGANQITLSAAHGGDFDGGEVLLMGDRVYYAFYDTSTETWTSPVDFDFLGPVNEAIQIDNAVDDAGDFSNQVLSLFIRTEGKTYGKSSTPDIGIPDAGGTGTGNINFQVYRFPLSEATDLDYLAADGVTPTVTDVQIEAANGAGQKYDAVTVDTTITGVNSGTTLNVGDTTGIVVGSYVYSEQIGGNEIFAGGTRVDSVDDATTITLNKAIQVTTAGAEDVKFINGPHIIFHNLDQVSGQYFTTDLNNANSSFGVTINARDGSSANGQLTLKELYSWVQYQLRQSGSIDFDSDIEAGNTGTQNGKTSDAMLKFVGAVLESVNLLTPNSAQWGVGNLDRATVTDGTGVLFYNWPSGVIGNVKLRDNDGDLEAFPKIATGFISFGDLATSNLLADAAASFTMFFTYTQQHEEAASTGLTYAGNAAGVGTITRDAGNFTYDIDTDSYMKFTGFTNAGLDGVFKVTSGVSAGGGDVINVSYIDDLSNQGGYATSQTATGFLRFNPVDSPDAVIVLDSTNNEIQGTLASGVGTPALNADSKYEWSFAYTANTQPNQGAEEDRITETEVPVTIRAVGTDKAQWISSNFTIADASGQDFSVIAPLERNYAP